MRRHCQEPRGRGQEGGLPQAARRRKRLGPRCHLHAAGLGQPVPLAVYRDHRTHGDVYHLGRDGSGFHSRRPVEI